LVARNAPALQDRRRPVSWDRGSTSPADRNTTCQGGASQGLARTGRARVGDEVHAGRRHRFTYPEGYNTRAGFGESKWGGNYQSLYYRAYSRYSSNFVISKSSTKHWEINSATSQSFSHIFANQFGNPQFNLDIVGFQYPPGRSASRLLLVSERDFTSGQYSTG